MGTYRFTILGISLKKLERSTSFTVADHWILYENKWAKIAWDTGIDRPPKKKKLLVFEQYYIMSALDRLKELCTYKNGIQSKFSKKA